MRRFFYAIFSYFLTPWGPLVLGALDSSMLFFLPFGIDMVVIIMAARHRDIFWLFPLLATAGSAIGAAATFWMGKKAGENGLGLWMSPRRLGKIKERVRSKGAVAMAVPAIFPPPFPFTPFILACGALDVDRWNFFATLALMRLLRFGAESLLALSYGRRIIGWLTSEVFETVISIFVAVAALGTAYSVYRLVKSTRGARPHKGPTPEAA